MGPSGFPLHTRFLLGETGSVPPAHLSLTSAKAATWERVRLTQSRWHSGDGAEADLGVKN